MRGLKEDCCCLPWTGRRGRYQTSVTTVPILYTQLIEQYIIYFWLVNGIMFEDMGYAEQVMMLGWPAGVRIGMDRSTKAHRTSSPRSIQYYLTQRCISVAKVG